MLGSPRPIPDITRSSKPSRLGGSYSPDDHNHAHTPLQIIGLKDGKPVVIATE
jgi:branched-chain amino acid transport system substrate-binding protein